MHTLTEIVKNNIASFSHCRALIMYYYIIVGGNTKYTFPVYLQDIADATLHNEEKAILLMRYIRKAIDDNTLIITKLDEKIQ